MTGAKGKTSLDIERKKLDELLAQKENLKVEYKVRAESLDLSIEEQRKKIKTLTRNERVNLGDDSAKMEVIELLMRENGISPDQMIEVLERAGKKAKN